MAAKFTQEPFKVDMDGDIVVDVGECETMVAQMHGMDGECRSDPGPETDANRRLILHSQALYRLAERIQVANSSTSLAEARIEAKRLVDAIDGVKPKLEWRADGACELNAGPWSIRRRIDGKFTAYRNGILRGILFDSLEAMQAYCQEQEDGNP